MRAKICMEIVVIFLIGTGCATYGEVEKNFGKSQAMAKNGQILNPSASRNLKPVTGVSGRAAEGALEQYNARFQPSGKKSNLLSQGFAIAPIVPAYDPTESK